MNKELFVSSTPHETRMALTEDSELVEVYYEREREYSLAGSIYKGRVTRVLPGMQSAFVDIGLERDAFLYVSDFFEDVEEYDRIVTEAEDAAEGANHAAHPAAILDETTRSEPAPHGEEAVTPAPEAPAAAPAPDAPVAMGNSPHPEPGPGPRRGRRRRGRHGRHGFPESKFAASSSVPGATADAATSPHPGVESSEEKAAEKAGERTPENAARSSEPAVQSNGGELENRQYPFVLPGESLAKYRGPRAAADLESRSSVEHDRMQPDSPAARWPEPTAPAAAPAFSRLPGAPEEASENRGDFESENSPAVGPEGSDAAGEPTAEGFSAATGEPSTEAIADRLEPREPELDAPSAGEGERAEVREREGKPRFELRFRRRRRGHGGHTAPAAMETVPTAPRPARPNGAPATVEERGRGPRLIGELLRAGQEILVQVAKEPLGTKGARITSHLALPGRYLVYMPTVSHTGVSRKIAGDQERARLKRIILENSHDLPGGFIVRTAGQGASEEEIQADIRFLSALWGEIRTHFEQAKAPALLHHDLGLVERTLRDHLSSEFTHIWVDSEEQYQLLVRFVDRVMPELTPRVRLFTREAPLFEHFGVQEEINKALKSKVWLKSGGYIVINQTEALVAIDVNTGKYVGRSNRLEDTIVKTNVDAIREIVRQIRLRDLGGIIVIDFIDMDERKNRQKVMQALEEAMRADRAPSKILSFNDFGLVALTRKRVKQSLERSLGSPCPYCAGVGLVKSVTTVCNEIYLEVRKMARTLDREELVLRVHPEVAKALKARDARLLGEMEAVAGKPIAVRGDPIVHQEQFEIF